MSDINIDEWEKLQACFDDIFKDAFGFAPIKKEKNVKSIDSVRKSWIKEELEASIALRNQYIKELSDASLGKGMCYGMPISSRKVIQSMLIEHINDRTKDIQRLEKELESFQ